MKRTLVVFLITLACFGALYAIAGNTALSNIISEAIGTAGLAYVSFVILQTGFALPPDELLRDGWIRMGIGCSIWVIAGVMRTAEEALHLGAYYGTVADGFFLFGGFPVLSGMNHFVSRLWKQKPAPRKSCVIGIAVLFAIFLVLFYLFILPQVLDPQRSFFSKTLDVVYPVFDLLFLTGSVCLLWNARERSVDARPYWLLTSGFALLLICDLVLSHQSQTDSWLYLVLDVPYFCSYIQIAFAADAYLASHHA